MERTTDRSRRRRPAGLELLRRRWGGAVVVASMGAAALLGTVAGPPAGAQATTIDGSWQLRICFSAALKKGDSRLAGYERRTYPTSFTKPAADGSVTGSVANYPLGRITMVGRWDGTTYRVTNWYLGTPTGATQGTASLTVTNGVLAGPWETAKGNTGTWSFGRRTPSACGVAQKATAASTTAKPATGGPVRVKVVTTASDDPNSTLATATAKTLTIGGQQVTTEGGGTTRIVVPEGRVVVAGTGLSSIVVSDSASGTSITCSVSGPSGTVALGAARAPDSASDYTIAVRFAPGPRTGVPACNGQTPGGVAGSASLPDLRFDATVELPGFPFTSRNCGRIATQFLNIAVNGGYTAQGGWFGGGNIAELAPKDIVPPNASTPANCDANGIQFWVFGGSLHVQPTPGGTVRTLTLQVWIAGGDQLVPQQCLAPSGAARREGTITLIDSDQFLRPQSIEADEIVVGPFGAGCTEHDLTWSNTAFASGIGAIPKAVIGVTCSAQGSGFSGKNC